MWNTPSWRASISKISLPLKLRLKLPRPLPRASPLARQHRLLLRHRVPPRLFPRRRLLPCPLLLLLRRRLLQPRLPRHLLLLALCVRVVFRRCVPRALLRLRLLPRPVRLRLRCDLAQFRRLRVRGLAFRCALELRVQRRVAFLTELPDSLALLPRVQRPQLHPRLPERLLARRDLRVRRRAAKDFRRHVHRCSPAKGIKGKGLVRLRACVPQLLRAARLVRVVRLDPAVLRVPVVVLPEDFRNVPAALAAVPGKLRLAASVPAPLREACPKLNQGSHSTRASRPPRVGVRLSRSVLPKASAVSILCARAQVRARVALSSSRLRPFNASRAKSQ
jgi:hypothetical protein